MASPPSRSAKAMPFLLGLAALAAFCIVVVVLLVKELRRQGSPGGVEALAAERGLTYAAGSHPIAWTLTAPGESWTLTAHKRVSLGDTNVQLTQLKASVPTSAVVLVGELAPKSPGGVALDDPRLQPVLAMVVGADRLGAVTGAQRFEPSMLSLPASTDVFASSAADLTATVGGAAAPLVARVLDGSRVPAVVVLDGSLEISVRGIETDPGKLGAMVDLARHIVEHAPGD
jgi:hypothetical protein